MGRLVLVRHGLTAWNAEGRYATRTNVPLSAVGEEQARHLGSALAAVPLSAVFSSPLVRAVRTTELIVEERPQPQPVTLDDRLVEVDAGVLEGLVLHEREAPPMRPHARAWTAGGEGVPGAESDSVAAARVRSFLDMAARQPGTSLAVSHEHLLGLLVMTVVGAPLQTWRRVRVANATLTVLDLAEWPERPRLLRLGVPAPFDRASTPAEAEAFRRQLGLNDG